MIDSSQLLIDFANALQPPPKLTVSEHAESTIVLPAGESEFSGKLKLSRSPYLRFIMDEFANPEVDRIYCSFGTQIGKTLLQLCIMNYIVDCAPGEMLLSYPSNTIAKNISKARWRPLFMGANAIPTLASHTTGIRDDISQLTYILDRMKIHFSWDSIISVSMWPKKYILKDETKDLDAEVNEACDDRVKNAIDSKIVECSSPLHLNDNIWKGLGLERDFDAEDLARLKDDAPGYRLPLYRWKAGDFTTVYFYRFPCPKCKTKQEIFPDQIRWPRDCAIRDLTDRAYLVCVNPECQHKILERDRRTIVEACLWETDNPGNRTIGFHLNSCYSLLSAKCTFGEVVARYLRVRKTPKRLKAFMNNYLTYPWIEEEHGINAVQLDFSEPEGSSYSYLRNTIPEAVKLLVAGFDVHKSKIYYTVWGIDEKKKSYLISWGIFDFDIDVNPDDGEAFVNEILDTKYFNDFEGLELPIAVAGIDAGWRADLVYEWVRKRKKLQAVKGFRGECRVERGMQSYILSSKKIDKTSRGTIIPGGLTLRNLNTGYIKNEFYEQIAANDVMFPSDLDQVVINQIDSEKIVQRKNSKGGYSEFFVQKTRKNVGDDGEFVTGQNHYLDTCVYAIAARELVLQGKPVKNVAKQYYTDVSDEDPPAKTTEVQVDAPKLKKKRPQRRRPPRGSGGFVNNY